jgi:probable addiction module antidote protein
MKFKDYREDLIERLKDPEYSAAYLGAVLLEKDKAAFLMALKDVVEARGGMTQISKHAGVKRPRLYKVLSSRGNPTLETLQDILEVLDLRVTVAPAKAA